MKESSFFAPPPESKPNPFRGPESTPKPPSVPPRSEVRERKPFDYEKLGVEWKKFAISNEAFQKRNKWNQEHGQPGNLRVDEKDMQEYQRFLEYKQVMKFSETPTHAEWMFLEGADLEGVSGEGYNWFGDRVVAYPPHKMDDVLRRTDAILMFLDEEDESTGYPLSVDITISEDEYKRKLEADLRRVSPHVANPLRLYWLDTKSEEPGAGFSQPGEGKVLANGVTVYLPPKYVDLFRDSATPRSERVALMKKLQPFVLRQMQIELETQALSIIHELRVQDLRKGQLGSTNINTREKLITELLVRYQDKPEMKEMGKNAAAVLEVLWRACDEAIGIDPEMESLLPETIRNLKPLLPTNKKPPIGGK